MMIFRRFFVFLLLVALSSIASAQYFPRTGRAAIYQRSLDVRGRLNVLSIALRPGYEDLETLAYFRLGQGAQIVSAFVTNGEAGESDVRGEYPNQFAAKRRAEASEAIRTLDGGALFLNMPDIVATSDSNHVRSIWRADTLRNRLVRLISDFHPDIILVARDWLGGTNSPQRQVLQGEVHRVVRQLASGNVANVFAGVGPIAPWKVPRVLVDDGARTGARASVEHLHPIWKKSFRQIGDEAAHKYASIATQRRMWLADAFGGTTADMAIRYRQLYPAGKGSLKQVDQDLPGLLPSTMAEMGKGIAALTNATLKGESRIRDAAGNSQDILVGLSQALAPLDRFLRQVLQLSPEEKKIGLQWKGAMEELRLALLGVDVRYTIDETVLTERQLARLKIDTITGIRPGGRAYLYFPLVDEKGWIVNETPYKQLGLSFHRDIRLLSPQKLEYDLPASIYGIQRSVVGNVFPVYVIHEGAKAEESFVARIDIPITFAPRFTAETLTPVVRVIRGERLAIELTNNSRDGVRDSVAVDDSLVFSSKKEFRLNAKGGTHRDTLILEWKRTLSEGTYSIPVKISGTTVAAFAARRFNLKVDESKHVALFTGVEASPTAEALRRLGVSYQSFGTAPQRIDDLAGFQVVIIDRRAMTLDPSLQVCRPVLEQFVQRGGHLIILAQDAGTWNARPLIDNLSLKQATTFNEETAVDADSSSRMLTSPNEIHHDDWTNWLFQRSYNLVSGRALESAVIPVKTAQERAPLVIQWKRGAGTLTYTDLALQPQFLNVHAGACRLLANLISY